MMIIREMYINKNTLSDLIQFSNNSYNTNYKCSFVFRHWCYGTSSSLDKIHCSFQMNTLYT